MSNLIKKFKDFLNESIESPEVFSAYNGRYTFNIDKAYSLINDGEVDYIIKKYDPHFLNQYSRKDISYTDPVKIKRLQKEIDYSRPLGILVKFKNPETPEDTGEWILIDGNHRVRVAARQGKSGDLIVVKDPQEVDKFMTVDLSVPHELFPDY